MGIFAKLFEFIGGLGSINSLSIVDNECTILFYDEPECPKHLIEK